MFPRVVRFFDLFFVLFSDFSKSLLYGWLLGWLQEASGTLNPYLINLYPTKLIASIKVLLVFS
jgi:hypothetical protein